MNQMRRKKLIIDQEIFFINILNSIDYNNIKMIEKNYQFLLLPFDNDKKIISLDFIEEVNGKYII